MIISSVFNRSISLVATAFMLCWGDTGQTAQFQSVFGNDDYRYRYQSEAPEEKEYNNYVRMAILARAHGDLKKATEYFEGAAQEPFAESPNYELWPDLAELYCSTGKRTEGIALAREYACAVDVMAAKRACWIGADRLFRIANPKTTPLCYATVCSIEYEAYYGQGRKNKSLDTRDKSDYETVKKLNKLCFEKSK